MSKDQTKNYEQFKQNVFVLLINNEELSPSNINYEGEMNNGLLLLNIILNYINDKDFPDNKAVLLLPLQNFQMLCKIKCLIDDKPIQLDIHEILEEQEKQINATGQNVISLGFQYFKINIGVLPKGSKCNLEIQMNVISTNTNETTYQTIIPISKKNPIDNFSFKITYSNGMKVSTAHLSEVEADFNDIEEKIQGLFLAVFLIHISHKIPFKRVQ